MRNEGITEHIETLNKQLDIRDDENSKLLGFADLSKQTIDQMEKKIYLLEQRLENRTIELGHLYNTSTTQQAESEEIDNLIM